MADQPKTLHKPNQTHKAKPDQKQPFHTQQTNQTKLFCFTNNATTIDLITGNYERFSADRLESSRENRLPLSSFAAAHHQQEAIINWTDSNQMAPLQTLLHPADDQTAPNRRPRRSPMTPSMPASLLMPMNELRVSGSKSEPPSRPSVDWSKQRPYFGPDMVRNVSVELGKTAYLTCKVFELGDKTVS